MKQTQSQFNNLNQHNLRLNQSVTSIGLKKKHSGGTESSTVNKSFHHQNLRKPNERDGALGTIRSLSRKSARYKVVSQDTRRVHNERLKAHNPERIVRRQFLRDGPEEPADNGAF